MTYAEYLLALVMWREARGEGEEGMRAVGHVIRNRVSRGWGNWVEVMAKPLQFTSINPPKTKEGYPKDPQTCRWPAPDDVRWITAEQLAHQIYSGQDDDPTQGALYYANLQTIDTGGWFEKNILADPAKFPPTVVIGHHSFYREA